MLRPAADLLIDLAKIVDAVHLRVAVGCCSQENLLIRIWAGGATVRSKAHRAGAGNGAGNGGGNGGGARAAGLGVCSRVLVSEAGRRGAVRADRLGDQVRSQATELGDQHLVQRLARAVVNEVLVAE